MKAAELLHIPPYYSRTVIDSEKVQPMQIESRPWAFQRAINQGRASPLMSPKLDLGTQISHRF